MSSFPTDSVPLTKPTLSQSPTDQRWNLITDDQDGTSCTFINTTHGPPDEFHISSNLFGPSTVFTLKVTGDHPTIGLDFIAHSDHSCIVLKSYIPSTPAEQIPQ